MLFNNNQSIIGRLDVQNADPKIIKQFYRASPAFVYEHGDATIKEFLTFLEDKECLNANYVSIDSRTHMLMPEWYPCIPGWHCDDFYRPEGQPDLQNLPFVKHYSMVIGADVATTEFVWSPVELPSPEEIYEVNDSERPLYGYYNEMVDGLTALDGVVKRKAFSGEIIEFDGLSFHRGLPAQKSGWRSFIRATVSNHREPKNEIRNQTQVYLTDPFKGW